MFNQVRNTEWYTPSQYIEAARRVMDSIDLDPASNELANETVKATRFYTPEQDGLLLPWSGNVWLNPPFGRVNGSGKSMIGEFVRKLVEEYRCGNVKSAIALLPVQTNSKWATLLEEFPFSYSRSRVHFNIVKGGVLVKNSRDSHMLGTMFVYFGQNLERFIQEFKVFGPVYQRIDEPAGSLISTTSLWD